MVSTSEIRVRHFVKDVGMTMPKSTYSNKVQYMHAKAVHDDGTRSSMKVKGKGGHTTVIYVGRGYACRVSGLGALESPPPSHSMAI